MIDKQKVASDSLWYTFSVYAAQFLGIVSGIATRKFLEPAEMGTWVALQTLLSYALLSELGILTAMYCRVPVYAGGRQPEKENAAIGASFTFAMTGAVVMALIFLGLAATGRPFDSAVARTGLAVCAAVTLLTLGYNFYVSLMWARHAFSLVGRAVLLNAVLQLVLVFVLVPAFGLYGLYASSLSALVLTLVFVVVKLRFMPTIRFDWKTTIELLRFGAPIFLSGMVFTFFLTLDRVLIVRFLDMRALGHYSIALVAFSFSSIAPKMFSIVLFPWMQREFDVSGSMEQAMRLVVKPDLLVALLSPLVLGFAYLTIPFLVQTVLVKYAPGIRASQSLLLGSFFLSLVYNAQSFLIAINKRVHSIPFLFAASATATVGGSFFISRGMGIEGAALGMGAGFFAYFASLNLYALSRCLRARRIAQHFSEILLCFGYFVLCVRGLDNAAFTSSALGNLACKLLALGVLWLPVLWWADHRTSALRQGLDLLRKRASGRTA